MSKALPFFILITSTLFCVRTIAESEREAFLKQFAKDPSVVKEAATIEAKPETEVEAEKKPPPAQIKPALNSDDELEVMINEMQADQEKQKELLQQLKSGKVGVPGAAGAGSQPSMANLIPTTADGGQDYAAVVRMLLEPYQKLSSAQLETLMSERFGNTPLGAKLMGMPWAKRFIVKMVQHPSALSELAKIGQEKKKLITYGGFVILTFFLGSMLKRLFARLSSENVGSSLRRFLFRVFFMTGLRLSAFVVMFSANLKPTLDVIKSSFLGP